MVFYLPDGIDLSGLNGTSDFALVDESGANALLPDVATDGLTNVIANTASALDIRQELQATITLNDLGNIESHVRLERIPMALGQP